MNSGAANIDCARYITFKVSLFSDIVGVGEVKLRKAIGIKL